VIKVRLPIEGDFEMNRFKKTITSAVTCLLMLMAFAVVSVGEAEGQVKARFDQSYLPPGNAAKFRRPAKTSATRKTARSITKTATATGTHGSRRAGILPYMEQSNLYR
jgi:hypothetical protein